MPMGRTQCCGMMDKIMSTCGKDTANRTFRRCHWLGHGNAKLRTSPCCVLRTTGKPLWVVLRSAHRRSLICIFSCSRQVPL